MAQASRKDRKIRRLKLDRRHSMKIAEAALFSRDQARFMAGTLEGRITELETKNDRHKQVIVNFFESRGLGEHNALKLYAELYPASVEDSVSIKVIDDGAEPAVYDPINYPEGAARANKFLADQVLLEGV